MQIDQVKQVFHRLERPVADLQRAAFAGDLHDTAYEEALLALVDEHHAQMTKEDADTHRLDAALTLIAASVVFSRPLVRARAGQLGVPREVTEWQLVRRCAEHLVARFGTRCLETADLVSTRVIESEPLGW